ncbi:transcription-repair coupling factor [Acidimicrobium ferrooxidans DSM 10331]|uniref:Transcription-repair-coupling factor n=1 Tax=Acidimicrobium ferrooxidans (strain DSM 10331 / JCM 15462 / NBRC 103882 / ICP) TaxID=525909 RepID=C7M0K8_ACIFD|nr:transcription-repair coupling factor [Acidimicrobium ferrooxidans]ACU54516.1 transcription-repair coupling factor [Acidimicrobium ferrooxidans DSM 10331]
MASIDPHEAPLAALVEELAATVEDPPALSAAGVALAWHRLAPRRMVVVAEGDREAEAIANDLRWWLPRIPVALLPPWDTLPFERVVPSMGTTAARLRALASIVDPPDEGIVVVTTVRAALTKLVASAARLERLIVARGDELVRDELITWLEDAGYVREPQVSAAGEYAVRGSIVDVADPGLASPVRIDLFGDEVDRLAFFDPTTQRSVGDLERVELFPAREVRIDTDLAKQLEALAARVPAVADRVEAVLAGREPPEPLVPLVLGDVAPTVLDIVDEADLVLVPAKGMDAVIADRLVAEERSIREALAPTWGLEADALGSVSLMAEPERLRAVRARLVSADPAGFGARLGVSHRDLAGVFGRIRSARRDGVHVVVATHGSERARHVAQRLGEEGIDVQLASVATCLEGHGVRVAAGLDLVESVELEPASLVVIADASLVRPTAPRASVPTRTTGGLSFDDLVEGSFVVHEAYGVARYRGLVRQVVDGVSREYLELEFASADRIFLPFEHLALVAPYVGSEEPRLTRLRGGDWQRQVHRARRAAQEVAQELVVLYQRRLAATGSSITPDPVLLSEFAERFPYELTRDQERTIAEVLADLAKPVPMDRLVCGDVGFGKTEIALRAAFAVASEGRQVLVLAPTTLLAAQHAEVFRERFEGTPIRVGMLSRLSTAREAASIRAELASGELDVCIATHAALGASTRFARLGLLVIDEEQRFGVRHKEQLKEAFPGVDVLVLSATPIPRSLELSLVGIRDLSVLRTAPVDRHPILTHVGPFDPAVVTEAIRRELLREGQVFFVHNRVRDIEASARLVADLVPEARVLVAHGQLPPAALERTMAQFWHGEADVLVATTIVENGIDLARANTLIVDRAEQLGLAQLHQLRGRVGRSGRQAYAYLLTSTTGGISDIALERLRTVAENTDLGAGYRIAMRDLELRGAGTVLGMRQSGHVSEVGYELYVRLVAEEVARMDGVEEPTPDREVALDVPVSALLAEDYVAEAETRMDLYRRLARARSQAEFDQFLEELRDRFGPPPAEALALVSLAKARRRLATLGADHALVRRNPRSARLELVVGPLQPSVATRLRLERRLHGVVSRGDDLAVPLARREDALGRLEALLEILEGAPSPGVGSPQ